MNLAFASGSERGRGVKRGSGSAPDRAPEPNLASGTVRGACRAVKLARGGVSEARFSRQPAPKPFRRRGSAGTPGPQPSRRRGSAARRLRNPLGGSVHRTPAPQPSWRLVSAARRLRKSLGRAFHPHTGSATPRTRISAAARSPGARDHHRVRARIAAEVDLWHAPPALAREHGATDIVAERGDEGVARIEALTEGVGADAVLECVGTQESMMQAIGSARPGGFVSYVGVPHGVQLDGAKLFFRLVHLHGGPAPVRRFLPELIELVWSGEVDPGKVFDLTLPLEQVAEGYRAMDERRAIKTLLRP